MSQQGKTDPPLHGVRILDLTQALAGPFASMILADLGADVIKVEPPSGDLTRTTPPHYLDGGGDSLYFLSHNRNKAGIALDLKNDDGRAVLYDLVRRYADVVFYNFGPGVVDRLKIDHKTLLEINPRIITCNITGFGRKGPDAERRAVDLIIQAMAGGMSITGEATGPPVKAGVATADLSAGLYAAIGILTALIERSRTNQGVQVETSLFHSQLSLLCYVASYSMFTETVPTRLGSGHIGTVPSQVFPTRDGYLAIDAGFNKHFRALCEVIGAESLADDPRFVDRPHRAKHRDDLVTHLERELRAKSTEEWVRALDARGVPCGPVNDVLEALRSQQAQAYSSVKTVPYGTSTFEVLDTPIWFEERSDHPTNAPPRLGENTVEVLRDVLGYTREHIAELIQKGAVTGLERRHGPEGTNIVGS